MMLCLIIHKMRIGTARTIKNMREFQPCRKSLLMCSVSEGRLSNKDIPLRTHGAEDDRTNSACVIVDKEQQNVDDYRMLSIWSICMHPYDVCTYTLKGISSVALAVRRDTIW